MANAALSVIRPVVGISSRVAPRLAGRIAFDLFCRPGLTGRRNEKQQQAAAAAERRLGTAERATLTAHNGTIQTYRFKADAPARGQVLLVHGWTGRAAFMFGFAPPLLKQGYDVIALDLPGHGLSSGKRLNMPLAMDALETVRRAFGRFRGVVGHSFGGAVAVTAAAGVLPAYRAFDAQRLVLVAAPDRMSTYFNAFGQVIGLGKRAQAAMNDRVHDVASTPLDRFDNGARLREMATPTLVIHDRIDREIPFADAEAMAAAGPHITLMATEGLGHRRILHAATVAQATANFMAGKGQ